MQQDSFMLSSLSNPSRRRRQQEAPAYSRPLKWMPRPSCSVDPLKGTALLPRLFHAQPPQEATSAERQRQTLSFSSAQGNQAFLIKE